MRPFYFAVLFMFGVCLQVQSVSILSTEGWLESACVTWSPVDQATAYQVYIEDASGTSKPLDNPLIRAYETYWRADAMGLSAGKYRFRIEAILESGSSQTAHSDSITVLPHDRTGFAFWGDRTPGAYQSNGTLKPSAVVLYVTENNKNSLSLDVTGANANPCVGIQTILDGYKKGKDLRPLCIRFVGQITDPSYLLNGDMVVENNNNPASYITLEGVGRDAVADGWGIRIKNASNIEIRNLATMNCNSGEGDNIGLQQDNEYVWIHHCDFFYGHAGSDSDQAKGDGALDCKRSTYVTFSYNHFWDTGKSNLLGLSESGTEGLYITYHHNWYDHSDSRHPRVRFYSAHVYNNYYDGIAKYGVGSTMGSSVFVEGNYYRNCGYPMLISMQGSDVYVSATGQNDYSDMPTFSKEDGGIIKAFNNYMEGSKRFVPYGDSRYPNATVDFDAYVVQDRQTQVPSDVRAYKGQASYNNFDTDASKMYAYNADSPEQARANVLAWSGRMQGGDFTWQFNDAVDDKNYAVNTALKSALLAYKTRLKAVQGDTAVIDPGEDPGEDPVVTPEGSFVHNFTLSGTQSSILTITGNLSDSKGTVSYAGLTLTQCLKMESATSIAFQLSDPTELVLVFNPSFQGNVKIDNTAHPAVNGILRLTLDAGAHQISKGDVANLYWLELNVLSALNAPQAGLILQWGPNPTMDALWITSDATVLCLEVWSLSGVPLKRVSENPLRGVSLEGIPSGVYVLRFYTDRGVFVDRLVKW